MAESPRVTVLLTVYNTERYLRAAIQSMLSQEADFELLIVDDGSTDHSHAILRSIPDPRLRVITNSVNQGVTCSRQIGLRAARGEYIAVLDSDDLALPGRLRLQVEFMDGHPEVDVFGTSFEIIDEAGRVCGHQSVPTDNLTIRWTLLFGNCIGHSTVLYRRVTALDLGGYDERVPFAEDYDLWTRYAGRGGIFAQWPQPLTQWRRHALSLQAVELPDRKIHSVRTVAASIKRQTGQEVDADVALALFRESVLPARDAAVVARASETILTCLAYFLAHLATTTAERDRIVTLAVTDLFGLARRNPESLGLAARLAIGCLYHQHVSVRTVLSFLTAAARALIRVHLIDPWRAHVRRTAR